MSLNGSARRKKSSSGAWFPCGKRNGVIESVGKPRSVVKKQSFKLLLIGAGESGKTTVIRQMMLVYGGGFNDTYVRHMKPQVLGNVVDGAYWTIKAAKKLGRPITDPEAAEAANLVCLTHDNLPVGNNLQQIDEELTNALKRLCEDANFLATLEESSRYQIQDGWAFFLDRLLNQPNWGGKNWVPDDQDILHARIRTTGLNREKFEINGNAYEIIDVGGQRSERKKWLALFHGIHGLIFVQSLSEYDQKLFEDDTKNRLEESLLLWKSNVNRIEFKTSAVLLFLNKIDLLEYKFGEKRIPIPGDFGYKPPPVYDDSYSLEENIKRVLKWYKGLFLKHVDPALKKTIWIHVTTALDPGNMRTVIDACCVQVLQNSMQQAGFM